MGFRANLRIKKCFAAIIDLLKSDRRLRKKMCIITNKTEAHVKDLICMFEFSADSQGRSVSYTFIERSGMIVFSPRWIMSVKVLSLNSHDKSGERRSDQGT